MILKTATMKTTTVVALMAALAQTFAGAQPIYGVADCSDLMALPSFTADAIIDFTASPISCDSNTNTPVTGGISLELTSSLEELKLVNVRFAVRSGSSLVVSAPNLQWQSVETREDRAGAALSVNKGCKATFLEDVTFTGCSIVRYAFADSGGAIWNKGNLEFMADAAVIGTTEGGGLYNTGNVTFSGDARFEDNNNANNYNDGGGGLLTDDGVVTFKGSASFIGNEVKEFYDTASEGILYFGGKGGGLYANVYSYGDNENAAGVIFEGPALFRGNKAKSGAGLYVEGNVVFEDLVTFEDNVATSIGDASTGGAMTTDDGTVEFQAGVVATGNVAKDGGAFYLRSNEAVVNMDGPVTMTGNEARYQGGAVWNAGNMSIPQDAFISGNTAVMCPGIKNFEDWERADPKYTRYWGDPDGAVEIFSAGGGSTYYPGSSVDLCYLGEDVGNGPDSVLSLNSAAATCDAMFAAGTTLGGYSVLTWDTRLLSEIKFDVGAGDFLDVSCTNHSIIFVTGGGEVRVTSTTDAMAFTNIRFEVGGYSDLYFDVPELTMRGIEKSPIGGSTHVDKGSSLEFWWDVKFLDNSVAYLTDRAWNEYGGAAVFNAGLVKFRGKAYFRSNGQFEQDGLYSWNSPGGAILNVGAMEFERTAKFWYNFNLRGGNGGGIANSGQLWFHLRTVWRNNLAAYTNAEEGSSIFGGHGAALYNFGPVATTEFFSKATFRDNVGGFRGGAVGANGESGGSSSPAINANKITFEHKTFFKDNSFDVERPDTGGAALWVYQDASVEFQDRVVFRRNEAMNGGAIMNGGGFVKFASAELTSMVDNVAVESCPDIKNYDKASYHHGDLFGDIDDPSGECGSSGDLCVWYTGDVTIGGDAPISGESSDICEF